MKKVARIAAITILGVGTVVATTVPANAFVIKCGPCYACCTASK
ncbi:hypothetical protein [Phycicoccus duodecadis]|uniref:Uncharacterized protein n=1 Tax=Phycicoccus duodecadis TaxID=173053 RepID=A0A2N3YGA6_9MICO|nr:hypothetical protein [Phycicoccus duodecadis]PKW25887.1 hypothetical protein ATL31_0689 [Phycicoccus duodecadis]